MLLLATSQSKSTAGDGIISNGLDGSNIRERELLMFVHYPPDAIPARDPDDGGKPYPPRRKRLLPHSSTSPLPSRLRVFACPLISDSREGAKTRSPDVCSLPV